MQFLILSLIGLVTTQAIGSDKPFELRVLDAETGRGVPLVEVETTNRIKYVTDSAGRVAFDEPGLLGQRVFFEMRSHGYEIPKDAFGAVGFSVMTAPGERADVKIKRLNIAERLYRITGQGIYSDTIKLGLDAPLKQPVINGLVVGQDSTMAVPYRGKVHWFWGDTLRPAHPLGHFQTAGATSLLPQSGGLDPNVGVDLTYFTREDGFSRPMAPLAEGGLVWIDGVLTVPDESGKEVLIAHYSRRKSLEKQIEHGLMRYNDEHDRFEKLKVLDEQNSWRHPRGQATLHAGYIYFSHPFATTRVKATLADIQQPERYEAFGSVTTDGKASYSFSNSIEPIDQKTEATAVGKDGSKHPMPHLQVVAADTGKSVTAHVGSIRWNEHRRRWVMIFVQIGGSSFLGEVWYAEAEHITGPWRKAVKIATHEKYSFYNPVHHAFFDADNGRRIYFEGTYTLTFSGGTHATPRYEYNQMMYRLDLDNPRLAPAR